MQYCAMKSCSMAASVQYVHGCFYLASLLCSCVHSHSVASQQQTCKQEFISAGMTLTGSLLSYAEVVGSTQQPYIVLHRDDKPSPYQLQSW